MERIPVYLLWFFVRIRKHKREDGYLERRFEDMKLDKMLIEVQMLRQLSTRGLVNLSSTTAEKVYDPHVISPKPGMYVHRAGTETRVTFPTMFDVTPAGKYVILETLAGATGLVVWTFVSAFLGGLVSNVVG